MKRRNFLKGAGAAIVAAPVMAKAGVKEPVQPVAPEVQIIDTGAEGEEIFPVDLQGSRLWLNGVEMEGVMDMQMSQSVSTIQRMGQRAMQTNLDVRILDNPVVAALHQTPLDNILDINARFGDTEHVFKGVIVDKRIACNLGDLVEIVLSIESVSQGLQLI